MFERGNLSRRGFLTRSTAALVGAGIPVWFAHESLVASEQEQAQNARPVGPNDRITVGFIGTGSRAGQLLGEVLRNPALQVVAACDVDQTHLNQAAQRIGNNCARFSDYRQLLARQDIDAVFVVTPDHWHALAASAAMRAGKDVYCEKPLTLTVNEGKHLVRVSQMTNKILQTGSQQRSEYGGRFRLACELVRNGRIGTVESIETRIGGNPQGGPFPERPVPEGLNWDMWQGPTPNVPYVTQRCHYQFRWWYEYSGGKMTDWGAHHNDIAQWALNMDNSGPVLVEPVNATPPNNRPNSYNCHENFEVRYTYANGPNGANGTILRCMSRGDNGARFNGENNQWIFVHRGGISASNPRLLEEALPQDAVRLLVSTNHIGNFVSCVRSRQQPICNVNVGHRSVTVCHIGTIAIRTGQRLRWNPEQEQFVENAEANRWLTREMRAPWQLT
jgi:predicted dehydrogenase